MKTENKLDRNNVENIMTLTDLQQGLLFHYISNEHSPMYHEQLSLNIKGDLKLNLLQKSWQHVIDNNEMLRTVFRWKGIDKPVQIVLKEHKVPINYIDLTEKSDKYSEIENIKLNDLNSRIDITRETLRIYLCKLDEYTHEMIVSSHHIIYDGWSNGVILKELTEAYNSLYKNENIEKPKKTKFSEFIKYINNLNKDEERRYWTDYLRDSDNEKDCFRCKETGKYKEISYNMDRDKSDKIRNFARENKISLSSLLYASWGILLQKLNNSDEVIFGTTVSGRPESINYIDNMVGLFINTIPLRIKTENNTAFINLIRNVDKVLRGRKDFENTSLIHIKKYSGLKSEEELFNSIVAIENYPLNLDKNNILSIENFSITEQTNYNMTLGILTFDEIQFKFNFNTRAADENMVNKFGAYLERIIDALLNNPNINVWEIDLLSEEEKNQILYEFNSTEADYPKDKTIQELFEEQVERTPNNIAVVFEDEELTYKELNDKSNQVARVLRDKGVKADTIVGIMTERSTEMIIGIMGILKAGGAYLPIDPNYPKERTEYMLKDSKSKILLIKGTSAENIDFDGETIDLSDENLYMGDSSNAEKINNSNNLAYIIYTSGTTGKPKGVMTEHRALINRLNWMQKKYPLTERDAILQKTTYTFDVSVWEILWWSLVGAKVCMLKPNDEKDPKKIEEAINKYKITTIHFVPSMLDTFLYHMEEKENLNLPSLRQVFCSGEALNFKQASRFYKRFKDKNLINLYGPTEAAIDVSYFDLRKGEERKTIPIGKPIDNIKLYILDKSMNIAPIGITGELYIAGDGLARGYLNREELTKEKFVDNPFEPNTKMYKTGDLARWLPDGNIEYLGRTDNQVKIRGFRIELGEIENRLLQHEDIKEGAVTAREDEGEKYICAYVVSDKDLSILDLRNYLKKSLPEYMIPSYFVRIEKMPLTTNGKLDRRVLPEPKVDANLNEYEAPRNEVEEKLVEIWSEVLGVEEIGINDNFFELGGHSLKATVLTSKIHKELNKEIPLKEIFNYPTIKELSKYIEIMEDNPYSRIEKVEEKEFYESSSAQKRMYILQQFNKDSITYNMPVVFELEGEIDKKRIEETFKKLCKRHESLRTYFEIAEDKVIQKIDDSYEFKLLNRKDNREIEDIIKEFVKPFDLDKAPLFRVELVESGEKRYLLIDMHHIISDGISMGILIKEFTELYRNNTLAPLRLQYKDFAAWQNNFLKSEEIKKEEKYWIDRLGDEIPVLNMPTDYERSSVQSFEGDSISFEIDKELTSNLRKLEKETGTTMHMVLLSALNILLSKYSGEEDIVVGTPIAGRPHEDIQDIVGMFVNTLALRNEPKGDKKYIDFLKEVKENSLEAYENQSYQFEELVEKLDVKRDTSRNPLFDVMFNMVDTVTGEDIKLDDVILKKYNSRNKVSKFDITLNVLDRDEKIEFELEYCSKLFKKSTIERLSSHYVRVLENIVENAEIKICGIDLLSEGEKNQILYEFNNTEADYPKDKTIQELFEEQVERTPDNIAVVFEDKKLTYKELNEKSNQVARVLRDKGVKADTIVGIMVERSIEMIVGIIGILKAGGAYLPIDPDYPKERTEYMLEDSESKILLSKNALVEDLEFDGEIIDLFNQGLFNKDSSNLERINNSNNLAYIIYTSGTTGNPKGVMIEQRGLVNYIFWAKKMYLIKNKDEAMPLYSSISFDLTITSIFTPLASGNKIIIYRDERDFVLYKVLKDNKVTLVKLTPTHLTLIKSLNNEKSTIRKFIVGGENLKANLAKEIYDSFKGKIEIYNEYGPTEAVVGCMIYKYNALKDRYGSVPIGCPADNVKIYIVDNNMNLQPIRVAGELCIAGDGLARGYLNREELTKEKFVDNPFEPNTKIYKTGDLARWLPDGNIEYLGRTDNQVKIRGFRIELEEIENRLLQHEDIKEAVVTAREDEGEKYICAYVVSDKDIATLDLRGYLKKSLPEYMVPSYFMKLGKMPLTANGKLNRKSLPKPEIEINLNEYEEPRNETEEKLVKIWKEVLGAEKVGINDNFFELGGHSLKATVLTTKIHKELNKEIELKEIFNCPTIKGLGKYIESIKDNPYSRIEKVKEKEFYETSSAQKRMYILQQFDKDSVTYNMPVVFELEGNIDKERIEEAFKKLCTRHESLRTYFEIIEDKVVQKIDNSYEFKLLNRKDDKEIKEIIKEFVRPFDLDKAPLFRVELVESDEKIYLLMDMHHIISDGISMSILIKDFTEIYNGKGLTPLRLQYKDFAAWQNNFLKSEEMKKQEEYWINRFSDEIPVLNMPTDYERPPVQSFEGDNVSFEIDKELTSNLRKLAKETGTTMHMVLLSALNILLSKYSGEEDIVIGTPIAGRPHGDIQDIVGMFVNTLALRNKPKGDKKYIDFLRKVKENSLEAYENQSYQFEELVEKLNLRRDTSRNPLFDVMFNMADTVTGEDIKLDDVILKKYNSQNKISKFDITLNVLDRDKKLEFELEYCSKLFKLDTIERLSSHYVRVLEKIVENTEIKICEIDLLSEGERNQILYEFNNTEADYPKDKTIQELFEEQVERTPNNTAVVFEDKELTYKELNEKSNQVARVLRDKGVKKDTIVGIMIERSIEMIVGIMGILKAGGAYLPIDPDYPKERIEFMLNDGNAKLLMIDNNMKYKINYEGKIININDLNICKESDENLSIINSASDLIYVIYTSGTTGNPKGVMIEHKQINNFIHGIVRKTNLNSYKGILCITNICFDIFALETLVSLTQGLKIVIADREEQIIAERLENIIEKNNVEVIQITPSRLNMLLENNNFKESIKKLKLLLIGGEEIKQNVIDGLYRNGNLKIFNVYGPTETTVWSTIGVLSKGKKITIGKPIDNIQIYILKDNQVVPIGVAGELCIAGDGLARGYLNREELTKEKFVDNPFEPNTKMYKTGDLAKWLPDGNIEYLGRTDNQVKIRGFRIELEEIENRLLQHEDIKEAVVTAREDEGEKYICAYVVSDKDIATLDLRGYLKKSLPEYMVPSYFMKLGKMPLTANGKLNRKSLPKPEIEINLNEYEEPRNETEEKLVKIWKEVLGAEKVGINDNFFELGGHSLKATVLTTKIHKELNKEIELKEIFNCPTIKGLGKYIESIKDNPYSRIEKVKEKEFYETSSAQKRMYILQQFDKDSVTYNMPVVFELEGNIDKERIEEAFKKLCTRHESLRTYFEIIEDKVVQKIDNSYEFKLLNRKDDKEIKEIIKEFVRPFDLDKAPLFRVELVESDEKIYLLMDMHHIISDGISMSILIKDFTEIYNGKGLTPLRLQYKDFAAWQNNFLKSEEMKKQEEYWINRFGDEIPVLNMPTDYERPPVQSFEGDNVSFEIDKELTSNLRKLAKETGTTMHMVLLSALNILLSKYSGEEDIVIGTPIAGRPHGDIQDIVGMFVNTLALRNKPKGDKKYIDFLREVKENSLEAYENQSYQFEELVEKLNLRRDTSRNPLFDVMFNMADTVTGEDIKLDDVILKKYNSQNKISKFDITLNVLDRDKKLEFELEYCSKLFKLDTIERLSSHYVRVLEKIVENTEIKICEIDLLSEGERNQILYEFNNTEADYPKDKTIQELFEEQVERTPNNTAVVFEDKELTYKELNEKSNQVARVLRDKGVKKDTIVGIMIERSIEMVIGIMGILKAGGAYLPIDPDYPKERTEYMLNDGNAKLLMVDNNVKYKINYEGKIININDLNICKESDENLSVINSTSDLIYVIYTSGTTGNPKGVMIEHKQINNFIHGIVRKTNLNSYKSILCITNICFDIFALETLVSLTQGLKIVIADREEQIIAERLENIIEKNNVEVIQITPSRLNMLLENNNFKESIKKLKLLLIGGEEIKQNVIDGLYRNGNLKIFNVYGPTETTVWSTIGVLSKGKKITIGKPIDNIQIYILKDNQVVPIGVAGELCIAGDGLARGYLNREELTKEKFVDNPFEPNTKMYKTGDLARWLPDGNIEYLGRTDNQVKIRGFRIELEEIENRLLQHEDIKEAVVTAREDEGEKYICAYVVSDKDIATLDLRGYLKKSLPEYMVPSYFMKLGKMPLTANGKLNRKSLPKSEIEINLNEYEEPRNETEEKLVKIWKEVLGAEKVGINDNFFELGGHSLKAIQLISKINEKFNLKLPINLVYKYQKIKDISSIIETSFNKKNELCKKVGTKTLINKDLVIDENKKYEIEFNKEIINCRDIENITNRLIKIIKQSNLELNKIIKKSRVINTIKCPPLQEYYLQSSKINKHIIPYALEIGEKDVKILKHIMKSIINDQSIFRFIVKEGENRITHYIEEHEYLDDFKLPYIDISMYDMYNKIYICESLIKFMNEEFELIGNIAYRIVIIKFDANRIFILIFISHFITDGFGLIDLANQKIYGKTVLNRSTFSKEKLYKDYEEERQLELEMISSKQLNNYLVHYLKHINIVKKFFNNSINVNEGVSNSSFVFKDEMIKDCLFSINTILSSILVRILSKLHNKKEIPLKLLYNGRYFVNGTYNNLLGDFHDNILINAEVSQNDCPIDTVNQISKQLNELRCGEINNNNILIQTLRDNPKYISNLSFQTDITVNIIVISNLKEEDSGHKDYLIDEINNLMKKYKKSSTDGISFRIIYNVMSNKGTVSVNYPNKYKHLYEKVEEEFNKELKLLLHEINTKHNTIS